MLGNLSSGLLASVRKHLTSAQVGDVLDRMGRPDEAMPMYRRSKELSAP